MNDLPEEKHFRLGNEMIRRIMKHGGGYYPIYMIHQSKTIQEADPDQAKKNLQIISSKLKVSEIKLERILKIIDEDIKYQKTLLTGNFEKDKPINWRLAGYKLIKQKLEENKNVRIT